VLRCPLYGRYRGKSGSETDIVKLSRRTQNGYRALSLLAAFFNMCSNHVELSSAVAEVID